jgi:hypothetical protein
LVNKLRKARAKGDMREAIRVMAILALGEGQDKSAVAATLRVSVEAIYGWVEKFGTDQTCFTHPFIMKSWIGENSISAY